MEFKKKAKKLFGIRRTSLDDQRTDIKAASSHQGGSRCDKADLASIGTDNHQDTEAIQIRWSLPLLPPKRGLVPFAIFRWFMALYCASKQVNKALLHLASSVGINGLSRDGIRIISHSVNSSYIASAIEFQFQPTYQSNVLF